MANETEIRLTLQGPEETIAAFKAAHIVENTNRGYDGSPVRLSFETFAEYPSGEGSNWAFKRWGSRYNAGYFKFERDEPALIECRFSAYDGDAAPIFRAIAKRYPDLTGTVVGIEEGGFYRLSGRIAGGRYRMRRLPWSEAGWEAVHLKSYAEHQAELDRDDSVKPRTVGDLLREFTSRLQDETGQGFAIRLAREVHGRGMVVSILSVAQSGRGWFASRNRADGELLTPMRSQDQAGDEMWAMVNEAATQVAAECGPPPPKPEPAPPPKRESLLDMMDRDGDKPVALRAFSSYDYGRGHVFTRDAARIREFCSQVFMPEREWERAEFPHGMEGLQVWIEGSVIEIFENHEGGSTLRQTQCNPPNDPERWWNGDTVIESEAVGP